MNNASLFRSAQSRPHVRNNFPDGKSLARDGFLFLPMVCKVFPPTPTKWTMTKIHFVFGLLVLTGLFSALSATAAEKPINTTTFGNLAVHGYDPVAYFVDHKPVEGKKEFSYSWNDAQWRFVSHENLEKFKSSPERYAPQYGGYCAYAVSKGKTADIDPEAWEIVNEKLYLNYNKKIQETWRQERDSDIALADRNWPRLIKSEK